MEGEAVTKGLAGMKPENAAYFYQHCIDASLTIMTESNHKLYKPNPASPKEAEENYRSIFVNPNQTDGEAIFIKGIVKEGSEFASSLNYFIEPYQTQGQGKMSPALNLVDAYEDYTLKALTYNSRALGREIYIAGLNKLEDEDWTFEPLPATSTSGVFSSSITITQPSAWGFKIYLFDGNWDYVYGGSAGKLYYKGADGITDDATLAPGTYTLTVDLINATYTIE